MGIFSSSKTKDQDTPDYAAIKAKQRTAWGSGDYSVVGTTLQIVGETLCEALDIRAGQRLLDVAGGNGNISLAAARRFAEVTCSDYVPELLERAAARATADGLPMAFQEADAENLPFEDASYDLVTSTFGAMFAPNQEATAAEMARVTRPGGKIGMANWTPDSFIGGLFKTLGKHVPPAPGLNSPALWGTTPRLKELFPSVADIKAEKRHFNLRYRSPAHWLNTWRTIYGPLEKAFGTLSEEKAKALAQDLLTLIDQHNAATDGTMVVPSAYLEIVITK